MKTRFRMGKAGKVLSFLLALALLAVYIPANFTADAAPHPFDGGSGTSSDPYGISTVGQFLEINNYLEDDFILLNNIRLTSFYDYVGENNRQSMRFHGTFDGDGHTISNLTAPHGLFVEAEDATIKNLNVTANIYSGESHVGALVGDTWGSCTIENCHVSGYVESTESYVGGLIGSNGIGTLQIRQSSFKGTVYAKSYAGGLLGENSRNCSITQCWTSGSVTGIGSSSSYGTAVGGLVGRFSGLISECYSTSSVTGGAGTGGLAGSCQPGPGWPVTIRDSYFTGSIDGYSSNSGGIAGNMQGTVGDASITRCYTTATIWGDIYAGGIVGATGSRSTVSRCYAINPSIDMSGRAKSIGRISGDTSASFSGNYALDTMTLWSGYGDLELSDVRGYNGTSLSRAQLQQQSTYSTWDFNSVWKMNPYASSYPTLRWQLENQTEVTLDGAVDEIETGYSFTLSAATVPDNMRVTWSASPAGLVELDADGNTVTVFALDVGEVTITAKLPGAQATCTALIVPGLPTGMEIELIGETLFMGMTQYTYGCKMRPEAVDMTGATYTWGLHDANGDMVIGMMILSTNSPTFDVIVSPMAVFPAYVSVEVTHPDLAEPFTDSIEITAP